MANLIFIGMVGSMAKVASKKAADLLGRKFVDTEEVLVRNMGITLHDIYTVLPINTFNELSLRLASQLAGGSEYVISVGDSILTNPDAISAITETGFTVYIRQPIEDILASGIDAEHPLLLRGRQRILPLFSERESILVSSSDLIIDYSETAAETAVSMFSEYAQDMSANKLAENTDALFGLIYDRTALLGRAEAVSDELIKRCISQIDNIISKEYE